MHRGLPWASGLSAMSVVGGCHLLVLLLSSDHKLHQLILYMDAMMMQHLIFWQQQLLK